jgi:hypothetical protein
MYKKVIEEAHKHGHDDELRYRLIMRALRMIHEERQREGFLQSFRRQFKRYKI